MNYSSFCPLRVRLALLLSLTCAIVGCVVKHDGGSASDTTTNWLHACSRDSDCRGESRCMAGTCTIACSPKATAACAALATEAACVEDEGARPHCDLPCDSEDTCSSLGKDYSCNAGLCRPTDEVATRQEPTPERSMDAGNPFVQIGENQPETGPDGGAEPDAMISCVEIQDAAMPAVWQPTPWQPYESDAGLAERFMTVKDTFVGRWHGLATPSWTAAAPYLVDVEFKADGRYSARCSEIMEPCCLVFNTGTDRDSDLKQYRLLDAQASGYLVGDVSLVQWYGDAFHPIDIRGNLRDVERDLSGNGLRLRYTFGDNGAPIQFDLRRVDAP